MPAYFTINGFVTYQVSKHIMVSLNVNNLARRRGLDEGEVGTLPAVGDAQVMSARTIAGRTTSVTLTYNF